MSSAQLSQILGHARADTFLKHYNSSKVRVDVQASFLGTPSKAALFKKVGQLRMRRSPDLPRALKPAEVKEIRESANIKKLLEQREQLRIMPCLADPESVATRKLERKRCTNQINSAVTSAKRKALQQKIHDFHSNADENIIAQQLLGQLGSPTQWTPVQHQLVERQRLCISLFQPHDASESRSALDDLVDLCSRFENSRVRSLAPYLPSSSSKVSEQDVVEKIDVTQSEEASPLTDNLESRAQPTDNTPHKKRWTPLTCSFCYGNPACGSAEPYKNSASLRRHLRHIHLSPLTIANAILLICPFPQCLTELTSISHIVSHLCTAHGTNLGSRSCFGC